MADDTTRRNGLQELSNEDPLSSFLATFLTQPHHKRPGSPLGQWVFWSQNERSQNYSSSDVPDPWVIHEKIKSAFSEVALVGFEGLIQFWAPVTTGGGRRLLTTFDQPFALKNLDTGIDKYRLCSLMYQYNVDVNNLEVEDDPMIISGVPASAFLNRLPEVVPHMGVHQGNPLVRYASECQLEASFVLPIRVPSQSCCVGVVECSMGMTSPTIFLKNFRALNDALKTVQGLNPVRDEIEKALQIVSEVNHIALAQVWIALEDENHVPFSSYLEDTYTKQMLMIKLTGHVDPEYDYYWSFENYYDTCDMLPSKIGKGLVGKTLQNYEPHFCINISKLYKNELVALDPIDIKVSCLAICLRSIDTNDFDYVFEFLWHQRQNYIIFLESLLLTLKRCLPSFKFASGIELGDELRVLDIEDSTGSGIGFFKIFEGNKLLPILEASEEERRPVVEEHMAPLEARCKTTPIPLRQASIEQQFGKTMKEAAKNLNVSLSTLKRKCKVYGISEWQGPKPVKRKVDQSYKNQSDMNEEYNGTIQDPSAINRDENTLTIKAEYANDMIKFHLPISLATFVVVEEEIGKKFKLNPRTYKLKYLDEDGDWILLISDLDMRDCIKNSKNLNQTTIRLCVLPYT